MRDSHPVSEGADVESLDDYRLRARGWLTENMERLVEPPSRQWSDDLTPEVMAVNRARQRKLFDGGYAGIGWPTEYGGQGLPNEYESAFLDEAEGYAMPDFGALSATTFHICVPTMLAHGSPGFLHEFIPRVLTGELLVCQFFSEPSSGSDLAGARTRATKDGDHWVLEGQKIWSTLAHLADWGLCLARTDWEVSKHRGLTWFAVPCTSPGLTIRPIRQINETAEFCEDFFDEVVVPDANRIGAVNDGWSVTQTMLVLERGAGRPEAGVASPEPGPLAPDLVRLAGRVGRLDDPVVRQRIARAHTNDFVGRVLTARIGQMGRLGALNPGLAAYVKLFRGTSTPIRARLAVEIGGADGMVWDDAGDSEGMETSFAYLNGRTASIAGGTNEMQRNAIAERALGLPREPSFDVNKPFSQVLRDAERWTGMP